MEASEFTNTSDVRAALGILLKLTSEPKSLEIRKSSKKVIISLFDLNAASLSLMLRQQPQPLQVSELVIIMVVIQLSWLQDAADKILKSYIQTVSSDEGEFSSPSPLGSPTSKVLGSHTQMYHCC